jgi:hypothetical protein
MDTIAPFSMGCITAVTFKGKSFTMRPALLEVSTLFDEKGHCLAATLLSMVILSFRKAQTSEQNACGTNFQKFP